MKLLRGCYPLALLLGVTAQSALASGVIDPRGGMETNDGSQYDIWENACHDAANYTVQHPLKNSRQLRGIVSCAGDLARIDQSGHTFSWISEPLGSQFDKICLFNWGDKTCWKVPAPSPNPPNIYHINGIDAVKRACGDQFQAGKTQAWKSGQLSVIGGPISCVGRSLALPLTTDQATVIASVPRFKSKYPKSIQKAVNSCKKCCKADAEFWTTTSTSNQVPGQPPQQARNIANQHYKKFVEDCRATCSEVFYHSSTSGSPELRGSARQGN